MSEVGCSRPSRWILGDLLPNVAQEALHFVFVVALVIVMGAWFSTEGMSPDSR
jgi:hypothetical protein